MNISELVVARSKGWIGSIHRERGDLGLEICLRKLFSVDKRILPKRFIYVHAHAFEADFPPVCFVFLVSMFE